MIEIERTMSIVTGILLLIMSVLLIIWLLYSIYYMNNNEYSESMWIFFRKPKKIKAKCPCGGSDPKSCTCKNH